MTIDPPISSFGSEVRRELQFNRNAGASGPKSQHELATAIPVTEKTLRSWLDGKAAPDPRAVSTIADQLKLSKVKLYELLGWLTRSESHDLDDPKELVVKAIESLLWTQRFVVGSASDHLQQVAHARGYDTVLHTRTQHFGKTSKPYRDYVGLSASSSSPANRRGLSDSIIDIVSDLSVVLRLAPALIEDNEATCEELQSYGRAQVWTWVPRLMATRFPSARHRPQPIHTPSGQVIETIILAGDHGSGADDLGALVAEGLRWGYSNTSLVAQQIFGRANDAQEIHDKRTVRVMEAYLSEPRLHRFMVISHGNPATTADAIEAMITSTQPERIAIFYPRANRTLIDYAARAWGTRPDPTRHPTSGEPITFQERNWLALERARAAGATTQVLDVNLPETFRAKGEEAEAELVEFFWTVFSSLPNWIPVSEHR